METFVSLYLILDNLSDGNGNGEDNPPAEDDNKADNLSDGNGNGEDNLSNEDDDKAGGGLLAGLGALLVPEARGFKHSSNRL
ncbi:unnamed protein product [Dicrocoelium dendriticum]|nr:unnamed protein product [Dicrocoelium dendriticum]